LRRSAMEYILDVHFVQFLQISEARSLSPGLQIWLQYAVDIASL